MNKHEAQHNANVMLAWVAGATIQLRLRKVTAKWEDVTSNDPMFSWAQFEYRVKPEPKHEWELTVEVPYGYKALGIARTKHVYVFFDEQLAQQKYQQNLANSENAVSIVKKELPE